MRTTAAQLPSYDELVSILAHEQQRSLPPEKEVLHFTNFTPIKSLLESYDLPTLFFQPKVTFEDLKDPEFFEGVSKMFNDLVEAILDTNEKSATLLNNLYDYLSEEDSPKAADLIFVFGSPSTLRTKKAIELFKKGLAPRILISGKGPFYGSSQTIPEAETLRAYALEEGVPEEALVIEKESITIPDNVKSSLNLLEKENIPHDSIILVNSPFVQRRGWAHFNKFAPEGVKLIRANSEVSEQYSREGWYHCETGIKVVVKEFFGLRVSELLNTS